MRFISLLGVVVLLATFLVGCGKSNSQAAPLTTEQKAKFGQTLESTGRVTSTVSRVNTTPTAASAASASPATPATPSHAMLKMERPSPSDPVTLRMLDRMKTATCGISAPGAHSASAPSWAPLNNLLGSQSLEFSINGATCPIEMQLSLKSTLSATAMNGSVSVHYLARDLQFQSLNDVYGFDFQGQGSLATNVNGQSVHIAGDGELTGALLSTQYGKLPVSLVINGSGNLAPNSAEGAYGVSFTMQFPDFLVDMREVTEYSGTSEPQSTYLVNGQGVSKEEFFGYFAKIAGDVSSLNGAHGSGSVSGGAQSTNPPPFAPHENLASAIRDAIAPVGAPLARP